MAVGNLERILEEVGEKLGIPGLKPDVNNTCQLELPTGLGIQVELDPTQQHVLIGVDLGEVPPGAYREMLFLAALQDNGTASNAFGVFAYAKAMDHMLLWKYMPATASGDAVADMIQTMLTKGGIWINAIRNGEVPEPTGAPPEAEEGGGLFGMKL